MRKIDAGPSDYLPSAEKASVMTESSPTLISDGAMIAESSIASARPRRILIIVENLPVPFDRRVWSEARALHREGYEVSIISPKSDNATQSFEVIDGIHIYRHWLPKEGNGLLGYVFEYGAALFGELSLSMKVLLTRGFDVIHACNPPDLIFLVGAFYKFGFGKRFVFDHHDINPELYEAKFERRDMFWRVLCFLERMTFRLADISIATNDSYRDIAIERGRMSSDRVFVVRSGPDLGRARLLPANDSWKFGRKFMVAYVGVIGKQEGLDLLVESVAYIRHQKNRDDVHFVIVGSGPEWTAVKKLAVARNVGDIVTFTGRVDDETLFTVLSTADVCVNPDRPTTMNDKSTMNKIMEYMAVGKPIVQFDMTEGRVTAGESSLYARRFDTQDFAEKILELLSDPIKCEIMASVGQKRVRETLSWDHEAPKLIRAYNAVFNQSIRARP